MGDFAIVFNRKGKVEPEKFLRIGEIETNADDKQYVVPFPGTVTVAAIGQKNVEDATLDIFVNGVIEESLVISVQVELFPLDLPLLAGDQMSIQNRAGSDEINEIIFTMILREEGLIPPPAAELTIRDEYRLHLFSEIYGGLIMAHGSKTVLQQGNTQRETSVRIKQIDEIVDALIATRP